MLPPLSSFVLVFLALVFPYEQAQPPVGILTIHGRVTDSSGAGLPGIDVVLTNDLIKLPRITVTDEEGKYSLSRLSEGPYLIRTEVAGFESMKQEIVIRATDSLTINMTVRPSVPPNCPGPGCGVSVSDHEDERPSNPMESEAKAEHLVGMMWELSFENARARVPNKLRPFGTNSLPALLLALEDPDTQMRQNGAIVLLELISALSKDPEAKADVRKTLPALSKALEDHDAGVRAWSAESIGAIGSEAEAAVPALLKLLENGDEASRRNSCIALGKIGPAASAAIPFLNETLRDSSNEMRQCASKSIGEIQN